MDNYIISHTSVSGKKWNFISAIKNDGIEYSSLRAQFSIPRTIREKIVQVAEKLELVFRVGQISINGTSKCQSCEFNELHEGGSTCIPLRWETFTLGNIGKGSIGGNDFGLDYVCPLYTTKKHITTPRIEESMISPINDIGTMLVRASILGNVTQIPCQTNTKLLVGDRILVEIEYNGDGNITTSFDNLETVKDTVSDLTFFWEHDRNLTKYFAFKDLLLNDGATRFLDTLKPNQK